MRRSILICLFFVFSIHAFADCPEYQVTLEYTSHLGETPDQLELCSITSSYDMGWDNYQYITIIYSDPSLLPSNIEDCSQFDEKTRKWTGGFTFDGTKISNNAKELIKYGIYAIFQSFNTEEVNIELINNSTSLLLYKHSDALSFEEINLETYLSTWDKSSKSYLFKEKKNTSIPNKRIAAMEASITSSDFKTLAQQFSDIYVDLMRGATFNDLPIAFSNKLWTALHKKALALYKKGDKKEAALLIASILEAIYVTHPSELDEYYNGFDPEYYYNYAIDALSKDSKLLTPISDCAFFLEQGDVLLKEAASIFSAILRDYPKRTVTNLNLADALWKQKKYEKAKGNYQHYVDDLIARNKNSVIPSYVYKRLDQLKRGE